MITSAQNGNWSDPATWTGGAVPNNDYVSIAHAVLIDVSIITKRIEINGANAVVTASPGITITFASTGNSAIGSGTKGAPAEDATYHGFYVARGKIDGALILEGTAGAPVNITAPAAQYFYIVHHFADRSYLGSVVLRLRYCILTRMGAEVSNFSGLLFEYTRTTGQEGAIDIQHCEFVDPLRITIGAATGATQQAFIFASNSVSGWRAQYFIDNVSGISAKDWVITDNTVYDSAYTSASPAFLRHTGTSPVADGVVFARNVVLGTTARKASAMTTNGALTSYVVENNVLLNYSAPARPNEASVLAGFGNATSDTAAIQIRGNIATNTLCAFQLKNSRAHVLEDNWLMNNADSWSGQGNVIFYTGGGVARRNISITDSTQGNIGLFNLSQRHDPTDSVIYDHNTVIGPDTTTTFTGMESGEGGYQSGNNKARSNLFWRCRLALFSQCDSFAVDPEYNCGVHHNCYWDIGAGGYAVDSFGLHTTPGFTNGVDDHPHANYAELQTDPGFVDSARRPENYDAHLGGPGTYANLVAEFARRSGLRGSYDARYNVPNMLAWLRAGFSPQNSALIGAGHDGEDIGAVPVSAPGADFAGAHTDAGDFTY